jgi:hypothetical protein
MGCQLTFHLDALYFGLVELLLERFKFNHFLCFIFKMLVEYIDIIGFSFGEIDRLYTYHLKIIYIKLFSN